jgi:integrase
MHFKHGSWVADWREEITLPDGTKKKIRRRESFKDQNVAKAYQQKMQRESQARKESPKGNRLVTDLCHQWMRFRLHPNDRKAAIEFKAVAGATALKNLTPHPAVLLVNSWKHSGRSPNTIFNYRYALRRLLKFLVSEGATPSLLTELPRVDEPDRRTIILNEQEYQAVLEQVKPPKFKLWLRCFLFCGLHLGLRRSEAMRIAPYHYDPVSKEFYGLQVKNNKRQGLPVPPELAEIFESVPSDANKTTPFIQLLGGPRNSSTICKYWKKLKREVGIREEVIFHDMRRTFASFIMNDPEGDILMASHALHHKSLAATEAYVSFTRPEKLREIQRSFAEPHRTLNFPASAKKKGA